jgi:hypothetical protein
MTTFHGHLPGSESLSLDSQAIWISVIVPCFQAPVENRPHSRWHLAVALRDEGSGRMSVFMEASLPHWSSHCLLKSLYWVQGLCSCGLILQLELPFYYQGHMAYLVIASLASFSLLWAKDRARCCLLLFSVASVSLCFSAILLPLSWFLRFFFFFSHQSIISLCFLTLFIHGVKMMDVSNLSSCTHLSFSLRNNSSIETMTAFY